LCQDLIAIYKELLKKNKKVMNMSGRIK